MRSSKQWKSATNKVSAGKGTIDRRCHMTTTTQTMPSVQKSVTVNASVEHAFRIFTEGFDTWWPRGHHIGKKPLQKAGTEPRAGGRCYGREADGNECQWG